MNYLSQMCKSLYGIHLSSSQSEAFEIYQKELIVWNERINLTAIRSPDEIINKHFLDSLSCSLVFQPTNGNTLIDIGTGAGFPGIPLKIVFSEINLTLVDSVHKKTEFCHHLISLLNLSNVEVITARAEEIGQDARYREKYDWAVARAVAGLPTLAEYLLPLIKINGTAIAQKGKGAKSELEMAKSAINELGGVLEKIERVNLSSIDEERYLIVIKKIANTPAKYPRRTGAPLKKPLH